MRIPRELESFEGREAQGPPKRCQHVKALNVLPSAQLCLSPAVPGSVHIQPSLDAQSLSSPTQLFTVYWQQWESRAAGWLWLPHRVA